MANPYWNNQHGANRKGAGGHGNTPKGSPASPNLGSKQKDRSGGTPKTGWFGKFFVKSEGI